MLTLTTAANGEAEPFRQKRQASRRMTHHPSACLSKSEAAVPGGRRRSQTEKTSKQTMNDLLACLWELWHNNGMSNTNLPPMGNAEDLIASAWGRTSVRPFFYPSVPDAGGRWRSVSDRKDKQAPRIIEEVLSARKENSGRLLVQNFLNNMGDLS